MIQTPLNWLVCKWFDSRSKIINWIWVCTNLIIVPSVTSDLFNPIKIELIKEVSPDCTLILHPSHLKLPIFCLLIICPLSFNLGHNRWTPKSTTYWPKFYKNPRHLNSSAWFLSLYIGCFFKLINHFIEVSPLV